MPVMDFNKRYLEKLIDAKFDSIEFEDILWKMGFTVEGSTEDTISVEITPNRPDMLDAVGFARAFRHFTGKSKEYDYEIKDQKLDVSITVGSNAKKVRPFIASFTVHNINFTEDSLTNLLNATDKFTDTFGRKRKKIAIGIHNLDTVSGNIEYDAYHDSKYVPLNMNKEMKYSEVLSTSEKGMKYKEALKRGTKLYPALHDHKGTLALIPILNSERTKVTTSTKNLLVDITGSSEYLVNKTAELLACSFIDMGATVRKAGIKYPEKVAETPLMDKQTISLTIKRIIGELGVKMSSDSILAMGHRMGYSCTLDGKKITFTVPQYRVDIINEQDVIEDLLIAFGYDNIVPAAVPSINPGASEELTRKRTSIEDLMIGSGYNQMFNSYLSNDTYNFSMMRQNAPTDSAVRIKNPKTDAATVMRTWLTPSLLRNVSLSLNERMPLNVFELDMAFSVKAGMPSEKYHIAAVSCSSKANFNDAKGLAELILSNLGLEYTISDSKNECFIEGRRAGIFHNGKEIGFFGEIHPEVLSNFKIEEPAIGVEITLPFESYSYIGNSKTADQNVKKTVK